MLLTTAVSQGTIIIFDENGHGTVDETPLAWGVDTPPVGTTPTLYYVLPLNLFGPNGMGTGDIGVEETSINDLSDVLRFIYAKPTGGEITEPRVYVYSEIDGVSPYDKADVGIPSLWYKSGTPAPDNDPGYRNEMGYEGNNYAEYTAPGAAGDITYHFISDVPEPATICLLGLGSLSLLRRKRGV